MWGWSGRNENSESEQYTGDYLRLLLGKKVTIHQVIAMLSTSKNVLFSGHIKLLTTGADDPTF